MNPMPKDVASKNLAEQAEYAFSKLGFLKNVDMIFNATLDSGIYNATPFEGVKAAFELRNGMFIFEDLSISQLRGANMRFSGGINAFENFAFENFKYQISTPNIYSSLAEDEVPEILKKIRDIKNFAITGTVSGTKSDITTDTAMRFDEVDVDYAGSIIPGAEDYFFNGNLSLKAPDFIKFVNRLGINYNPNVMSLGILSIVSDFGGNADAFVMNNFDALVGSNSFQGSISYAPEGEKPLLTADLNVDKFEIDRFFYNANKTALFCPVSRRELFL